MAFAACSSATPPPGTMPSSSAARAAWRASSTRCFFSFISVSVAAPTLTTATPPASFASRSWSFSRSKSESVFSISVLIWLIRPLMSLASPAPSMIVVVSLATTTRRALDVLGDDQERLARLDHLLEHRQQVADRADLLVRDQDVGVLEGRLHPVLVGDHVRRDVALVELHAL